jgi:ribonucleoside-diphosphate reductase alpha chain
MLISIPGKPGCKGITIYRDSSRSKQVLNVGDGKTDDTLKPTKRPVTLSGHTTSIRTALGNLFVTVNSADSKPFELFAQIGKAGSDVIAFTEAIARLISLALRCGVNVDEIVAQLEGIGGARSVGFGPNRIMSVPDAIGQGLRKLAQVKAGDNPGNGNHQLEICPDCGTCALIRAEGCLKCEACGFSEC